MLLWSISIQWDSATWLTCAIAVAAVVEAWALWKLFQLEQRQDDRATHVELPVRYYVQDVTNAEGAQLAPGQPMIEVMNCSTVAVYIAEAEIQARTENGETTPYRAKIEKLIPPFGTTRVNLSTPVMTVVDKLIQLSGAKVENGRALPATLKLTLYYRAHGKSSRTPASLFEGEILWREFRVR